MRGRNPSAIAGAESQSAAADYAERGHVRTPPTGWDEGPVSNCDRRDPKRYAAVVALPQSAAWRYAGIALTFVSHAGQVDRDGEPSGRNGARGWRQGDYPG